MSDTFQTINGQAIYYADKAGAVHLCEGAEVHPGVRLLWTLCGRDVPANGAYQSPGEKFTCESCRKPKPQNFALCSRQIICISGLGPCKCLGEES